MLGVRVTVPVACFRKGLAREYLETEAIPPPATCYGFLLSLVGEISRERHIGARVAPARVLPADADRGWKEPQVSVVLRTVWRIKKAPLGSPGNTRPDYQQLLSQVDLVCWLDSSEEVAEGDRLERRVVRALREPASITRFGGLCLGESTHLVDSVWLFDETATQRSKETRGETFLLADRGRLTLPVWVDHVGSAGTRYVTGELAEGLLVPPLLEMMPRIEPP